MPLSPDWAYQSPSRPCLPISLVDALFQSSVVLAMSEILTHHLDVVRQKPRQPRHEKELRKNIYLYARGHIPTTFRLGVLDAELTSQNAE